MNTKESVKESVIGSLAGKLRGEIRERDRLRAMVEIADYAVECTEANLEGLEAIDHFPVTYGDWRKLCVLIYGADSGATKEIDECIKTTFQGELGMPKEGTPIELLESLGEFNDA